MTDRRDMPSFQGEADALARVIAEALGAEHNVAEPDVVRLLTVALERAWLVGAGERVR